MIGHRQDHTDRTSPRWPALLVLCGALALHNVMRTSPVGLVEELRERYAADYTLVGNVIGAYTLSYGLAQLAAGLLTNRFGSRRLILVGLGLGALGSGMFALTEQYSVAMAARLIMGAAGGFLYTPTLAYVLSSFDRDRRGRAVGVAEAGVGIGQILALWGPPILFATFGLVWAFLSVPAAATLLILSVALLLPEKEPETRRGPGHLRALLKERDFWLLLLGFAFIGMLAQVAVQTWMPTYLRRVHGFGVVAAGLSAGIVVTGLTVFSPIFGLLSDRLTARLPIMLAGSLLALLGWLVLLVTSHPWVAVGAALLVSASMAATIPMQALFASERFAAIGAGAAIGLVNAGSQIGASLGGPLYGLLLDRGWGFNAVWGLAAALGIVRIGALLCIRETRG